MDIRRIDLGSLTYIDRPRGGTDEWYFAMDYPCGDIHEAQEVMESGILPEGTDLRLVHYPDGEVFIPLAKRKGLTLCEPYYCGGGLHFIAADFAAGSVRIYTFDCTTHETLATKEFAMPEIPSFYNLMLHGSPLTMSICGDDCFEIIYPERTKFSIEETECLNMRIGDKLYFTRWHEDREYREETVVRDMQGNIIEIFPGDMRLMPDGSIWRLG